jgi:lipopolysaccharide/colanic/teichoic acid biosynthesis glycosyltransferase
MSLVGPRPERPEFVRSLTSRVPGYERRLVVKPGLTGLAQVRQHADLDIGDVKRKIRYDLLYSKNPSVATDIKIMMLTVPFVFGFTADDMKRFRFGRTPRQLLKTKKWGLAGSVSGLVSGLFKVH